jgi:hypothetical protein
MQHNASARAFGNVDYNIHSDEEIRLFDMKRSELRPKDVVIHSREKEGAEDADIPESSSVFESKSTSLGYREEKVPEACGIYILVDSE